VIDKLETGNLYVSYSLALLYVPFSRATSLSGLFVDGVFEPPPLPAETNFVTIEIYKMRFVF
jgi:hypothetical protein